ncbi:superoxide dismutase Cu-Zn-like protein, partial [Leptotrombidium deliense]
MNFIKGTVDEVFKLHRNTYRIEGVLYGLKPGYHGFHVHESSDLSNACANAGPHYNPTGETHGCHHTDQRHAGDLGSIYANENGVASFSKEILGQLNYPHQICSRSIV